MHVSLSQYMGRAIYVCILCLTGEAIKWSQLSNCIHTTIV